MLQHLTYWHWFILAAILIILEVFAPGAFMLWIGIAAGVVGAVLYFVPTLTWEYQFILFSIPRLAPLSRGAPGVRRILSSPTNPP